MKKIKWFIVGAVFVFCGSVAAEEKVVRHANTGSSLPISTAVEVGGLLFHSGVIPSPANTEAERGTAAFWGNTEEQTDSVLSKLQASLQGKGMDMENIVKLNVYLVGDPEKGDRMDFRGFMKAYTRYFGEASNGQLPARAVVEIAGLVAPGMLVEIEAVAAR
jgi:enamine deaminase RidA (YjgF/YER057c/UK114 family)